MTDDRSAVALALAVAGFRVIPWDRQHGRRMHVKGGYEAASTDAETVGRWWAKWPGAVPGVYWHGTGIVCMDFDRHEGQPDGVLTALAEFGHDAEEGAIRTPLGGFHQHFVNDGAPLAGVVSLAPGIDRLSDCRRIEGFYGSLADVARIASRSLPPLPEWAARGRLAETSAMLPATGGVPTPYATDTTSWGRAALDEAVAKIGTAAPGTRNDTLNAQAFRVFAQVKGGMIDPTDALEALRDAADDCGLTSDDGWESVEATLASAAQSAEPIGPDVWFSDLPDDAKVLDVSGNGEWTGADERQIESEARLLRIKAEARRRVAEADAPKDFTFEGGTLDEVWAAAPEPRPLIEYLLPEGGNLLLTAQRKSGKTVLALNLAECLTTGRPFLGTLDTECIAGRVGFLNYELTPGLVTDYTRSLVTNPDRVLVVNLLGRTNPLASERGRAALAAHLRAHDVEVLCVDPFSGAAAGVDENSNSEVRQWLDELHRWAMEDVGARGLVLSNHAGWAADRSRGASSLEDWANVLGLLTLADKENKSSARFFSAFGRLGEVAEDRLDYDETTRTLAMSGSGGRRKNNAAVTAASLAPQLLPFVTDVPASGNGIITRARGGGVKGSRTALLDAVAELLALGRIVNASAGKRPTYRLGKPGLDFDPADFPEEFPDCDGSVESTATTPTWSLFEEFENNDDSLPTET